MIDLLASALWLLGTQISSQRKKTLLIFLDQAHRVSDKPSYFADPFALIHVHIQPLFCWPTT